MPPGHYISGLRPNRIVSGSSNLSILTACPPRALHDSTTLFTRATLSRRAVRDRGARDRCVIRHVRSVTNSNAATSSGPATPLSSARWPAGPVALRPHLSMSLPLIRELLCTSGRRSGKDWVADLSTGKFAARLLVTALTIAARARRTGGARLRGRATSSSSRRSPTAAELRDVRTQMPLSVYSRDGKLIAQIGEQRRMPVEWQEIPPRLIDAFLAAEDDRFFEHPGVDWQGLVRAAASNVSAGGVREGGGTITMQLARNTVLTSERTLRRKLKEVFLALRLEREFSKQEILTLYLNRIFLGQRAYGVGAAAQVYFDKRPAELTLAEAALIAGLPRSPSLDNPVASVERATATAAPTCCGACSRPARSTQAEHDAAAAVPIVARTSRPDGRARRAVHCGDGAPRDGAPARRRRAERRVSASRPRSTAGCRSRPMPRRGAPCSSTTDGTVTAARSASSTGRQLGDPAALAAALREHPDRGGLVAASSNRCRAQRACVRLRDGTSRSNSAGTTCRGHGQHCPTTGSGRRRRRRRDVLARGQVVYLEPLADGRHRLAQLPAVAGGAGRDRRRATVRSSRWPAASTFGASKYNRAVQARRQPGSAFKPFVYSAALERGLHAGEPDQRRADRPAGRRRHRGMAAAEHQQAVLRADPAARGAGALAQPGVDPPAARDRHRSGAAPHRRVRLRPATRCRRT